MIQPYDAGNWKPEISLSEQLEIITKIVTEQGYDFEALWQAKDTNTLERLLPTGQWEAFYQKWQSTAQESGDYFTKVDHKKISIEIQSMLNNALLVEAANVLRARDRYTKIPPIIPSRGCTSEQLTLLHKARAALLPAQPAIDKGEKFKSGRQKGSRSPRNKYIHELACKYPNLSAKELLGIADKSKIGDTSLGTFANQVTIGRKDCLK